MEDTVAASKEVATIAGKTTTVEDMVATTVEDTVAKLDAEKTTQGAVPLGASPQTRGTRSEGSLHAEAKASVEDTLGVQTMSLTL